MAFNDTYQAYEAALSGMKSQCATAEYNCIVAETNLKSLEERYEKLVADCQNIAGCSMDQIPEMLTQAQQDLESIMNQLSGIDISGEIDENTLAAIQKIVTDYGIK